ncbi:restriction endonuclease subunit S [Advenella alkanexedens]|uniref:Restriction endonuclease subunit S n=1 Tax=Advenella alkanexedens TaxID=1481665 RepID=A0ABS6NM93_9BURK|nr:restriction endonuclease subunit S [Advenella alkanexedens]MBV4396749.1 restriction endonuclease subunit S [Advenella alkanexedens]
MNKHTAELLEKHFDTAFAAPDGIKKLRELILTLAMQGKLVPQDPNEQPAKELLQEIEAEKQRLVKEGKIKNPKPLLPVMEEEKPYVLPQGWEWVRLRDICHDWGQRVPNSRFTYIDVSAIDNKSGRIAEAQIIGASDAPSRARKIVHPGDVVYSTVRPYLLNVAIIEREYEPEPIASTAFAVLHSYNGVLNRFVFRYLRSPVFIGYVERTQKGVAYPAINDGDFFSGLFPLPPSDEQHRIIAKIDELMARCDELEKLRTAQQGARLTVHAAAIKQLLNIVEPDQHQRAQAFLAEHFGELYTVKENVTELRKAILQLAVMGKLVPQDPDDQPASELLKEIEAEKQRLVKEGKIKKPKPLPPIKLEEVPYALPQGWDWVRLGSVGSFERGKSKHRPRNDKRLFDGGTYPFVQTGDVSRAKKTKYQILTCGNFYNDFGLQQSRLWEKKTLCITIAANIAETGFLGMDACIPDSVVAFLSVDPALSKLVKVFIDVAKDDLERFAPSTAQKNINLEIINELVFPLPPSSEQHRIVAKVDQLMDLCDSLDQQIDAVTSKQAELLNALINTQSQSNTAEQLQSASRSTAQVIDLATYRASIGCYTFSKLATAQYFGRTAAAKVLYLAQAHVGLELDLKPEREAAGPLDTWIYDFERQGQDKHWFEVNEKTLANGRKKTEYRCLPALSEPAAKAEALMTLGQKAEFDRLIHTLADKKTEEVEIIATLFAVWNDFLIDGVQPTDAQIISDVRENWHERKARFTPAELGRWLDWLRRENMIPQGLPPRTVQQSRLNLDG